MAQDLVNGGNVTTTRNACELKKAQGIFNLVSLLACTVMMSLFWRFLGKKAIAMDDGMGLCHVASVRMPASDRALLRAQMSKALKIIRSS